MKKKELLAMKELLATKAMLTVASENPIEKEERKTSWGTYWVNVRCKYARYLRAAVENKILKVAVFTQKDLEEGKNDPKYEVYVDEENEKWTTYERRTGKWREAKIDNLEYTGMGSLFQKENWQQETERKKVNEYFKTGQNRDIFEAVLDFQAEIKKSQLQNKHRSEIEQIDEVMREVPELPKNFENWIAKNCFKELMFYEPENKCSHRWPKMYCTHCKKWMPTPADYKNRPKHNEETVCPECKSSVIYKSWNKQKYVEDDANVGILQRLKDDSGWILRRFHCKIKRNREAGWEIYDLHIWEDARARLDDYFAEREYFEYGEYKYTGVDRWCHECRRSNWKYYYGYGYVDKSLGSMIMYTPNLKRELRREKFHKMDLKAVMKIGGRKRVPPATILRRLQRYPYMEYLQKSGLEKLMELPAFFNVFAVALISGTLISFESSLFNALSESVARFFIALTAFFVLSTIAFLNPATNKSPSSYDFFDGECSSSPSLLLNFFIVSCASLTAASPAAVIPPTIPFANPFEKSSPAFSASPFLLEIPSIAFPATVCPAVFATALLSWIPDASLSTMLVPVQPRRQELSRGQLFRISTRQITARRA